MKHFYKNTSFIQQLTSFSSKQRWYREKTTTNHILKILDIIPIANKQFIYIISINNLIYVVPLVISEEKANTPLFSFVDKEKQFFVYDGCYREDFCRSLWQVVTSRQTYHGQGSLGSLVISNLANEIDTIKTPDTEQSNTNIIYSNHWLMKIFRQPQYGTNPDFEINVFLSKNNFPHVPETVAGLQYITTDEKKIDIAIVQKLVCDAEDCWQYTVDLAIAYFSQKSSQPLLMEKSIKFAKLLGQRTAELHIALANSQEEAFQPTKICPLYMENLYKNFCHNLNEVTRYLDAKSSCEKTQYFLQKKSSLQQYFELLTNSSIEGYRIRCHGDYHLGQVLKTKNDIVILDFEGEPLRSLEERREKQSPFKDLAGMIRSFNYAGYKAAMNLGYSHAHFWINILSTTFLSEYLSVANGEMFLSQNKQKQQILLQLFLFDKALYELKYELNNRPDWTYIPLSGIIALLDEMSI